SKGKFLYPVKAMSLVFKAKSLNALRKRLKLDTRLGQTLYDKKWVVYAKRPFGNPAQVVEYLGRYTHKIAISNHRIQNVESGTVTFSYKDYKTGGSKKLMTLTHAEFISRFSLHIMPRRFVRIRHYGILSSTWKRSKLRLLQSQLLGNLPIPGTK